MYIDTCGIWKNKNKKAKRKTRNKRNEYDNNSMASQRGQSCVFYTANLCSSCLSFQSQLSGDSPSQTSTS